MVDRRHLAHRGEAFINGSGGKDDGGAWKTACGSYHRLYTTGCMVDRRHLAHRGEAFINGSGGEDDPWSAVRAGSA